MMIQILVQMQNVLKLMVDILLDLVMVLLILIIFLIKIRLILCLCGLKFLLEILVLNILLLWNNFLICIILMDIFIQVLLLLLYIGIFLWCIKGILWSKSLSLSIMLFLNFLRNILNLCSSRWFHNSLMLIILGHLHSFKIIILSNLVSLLFSILTVLIVDHYLLVIWLVLKLMEHLLYILNLQIILNSYPLLHLSCLLLVLVYNLFQHLLKN